MEVTSIGNLFIFLYSFIIPSKTPVKGRSQQHLWFFAYKSLAISFYLEYVNFING